MSIEVNQLTKTYGSQKAVNNVSFQVGQGEIVGFLGPNGAGKSTTMKVISCFIPPSEGKVSVCGYDVELSSIDVRRNIGYLPENNPLYRDMYIKEYLLFVAGVYGLSNKNKRIKEMIDLTGLGLEQRKKIGQLSKGYRQRVGLAQAMIHDPQVLILDEPTSGLDPNQLADIRELIRKLGQEKTVMLSTHIMQEVQALCDRVIIIDRGNIVANEATDQLQQQNNTRNIYIVEYSKKVEVKSLAKFIDEKEIEVVGKNTYRIASDAEIDKRPKLFKFAVENNLIIMTLNKEESSLEEVFRQVTK